MDAERFSEIAGEEWGKIPERFQNKMDNIALIIEDEPSVEIRTEEGLDDRHTLLGRYHGIPSTARGEGYGIGGALPDTITLYRLPILQYVEHEGEVSEDSIRAAIRETIWHEVGHYFGLDDPEIREREDEGSNGF